MLICRVATRQTSYVKSAPFKRYAPHRNVATWCEFVHTGSNTRSLMDLVPRVRHTATFARYLRQAKPPEGTVWDVAHAFCGFPHVTLGDGDGVVFGDKISKYRASMSGAVMTPPGNSTSIQSENTRTASHREIFVKTKRHAVSIRHAECRTTGVRP